MSATMSATMPLSCEVPPGVRKSRSAPRHIALAIAGTDVPDCACKLIGIDTGTLYVRSERQIAEASAITISFDHVHLSGVVAECRADSADWLVSVALASCRRRLEQRIETGLRSVIGVVGPEGTTVCPGTVVDMSSSGLGLRLMQPIEAGTRVCVETESAVVFGEVRHCRATGDGQFMAGVMIVEVVPDLHSQNGFSVMLNNLRWKLAASIRGRDPAPYRR